MKTQTKISSYSGYHHNRYDSYNSSWGVLMALGASPTADAFADADDQPDDDFDRAFNGDDPAIGTGDNDDFRETVLQNLDDEDIKNIKTLENGDKTTITQYWGGYGISIDIVNDNGKLLCIFDGYGPFEVTV